MHKRHHIALLMGLILLLTGCVDDSIIDRSGLDKAEMAEGKDYISFVQRTGNLTRATTQAQHAGHYEFGVWAFKGDDADKQIAGGDVMTDFLVAYTDGTATGISTWYKDLAANSETYGNDAGAASVTVAGDGISSWFYEGLGNTPGYYKASGGNSIQPLQTSQALKFWDKSAAVHNFFAYAPYFGHQAGVTSNVSLTESAGQNVLTYSKLSAFYTDPVEQTAGANITWAGGYPANPAYNNEILNANEGLYAAQSVAKAQYDQDVPLTFRHLNAKIKVAFYEQIPGYKVELLDLVPAAEATAIHNATGKASSLTSDKALIPATGGYQGIALSPATKEQAIVTTASEHTVVQPSGGKPLPSYYTLAKTIATDVKTDGSGVTSDASISFADGSSDNANLRFQKAASNTALLGYGGSSYTTISETSGTGASVLNTTYYTLPNWDPMLNSGLGGYMTQYYTADYTTQHVSENTGYTLHVSYKLVPEDGSDPDIVYDARVWVAPEYCHWQAGKQYTYVFRITQYTNGTTDPYVTSNKMFNDGDDHDPYVDPDDPRVPSDMALIPIIFDNVFVSDYEKDPGIDIPAALENVLHWKTITYSGTDYKFCPVLMKGAEFTSALTPGSGTYHALDHATIPDATGFDGSTRKFSIGADMQFFADTKETAFVSGSEIDAYGHFPEAGTSTAFKDENGQDISALVKPAWVATYGSGTISLPKYSMYIWSANDATTAEKYTATPLPSAVKVKPNIRVMQTTWTYTNCYKQVTKNYVLGTTDTKYYTTYHTEIDLAYFNTLKGTSTDPAPTYDYVFGYSYEVAPTGYGLSHATASPLPAQAYGLVK